MQHIIFLIVIMLTTCCKVFSQQKNFRTSYYTTENGLPSNGIKGLQRDEQSGFLWIATEAGISRFNGMTFTNFTNENTPFIKSERMLFMVKNNNGKIYTADQSGNLLIIKKNKLFLHQNYVESQEKFFNKRYIISVSDTFFNDQAAYRSSTPFNLLEDHILPTTDTSCYIIHLNRIYTFRMGMIDAVPYPDSAFVTRMGFKLNARCFVLTDNGTIVELYDDPNRNKIIQLVHNDGSSFEFHKNSRLYWTNEMENPIIISKNKAWLLSLAENKIIATLICDEVPTNALIEHVQYSQAKKILFIGTESKGLIVLSENRLDVMKNTDASSNQRNAYYSQLELENGNVLTNEGHVIGNNIPLHGVLPIKGTFTYFVSSTSDSTIWYSQYNAAADHVCLHGYDQRSGHTKIYPQIRAAEAIVQDITGKRLLVTEFGIGLFVNDSIQYLYKHPGITYNSGTYKIEEIEPGVILLAGCSGILKFNLNNNKLDTVLSSIGSCIRATWRYKDYIFFGTYGKGFLVWKNGVLKSMPIDKRKYLLYAHCFIPDDNGYCWISTNRGLFKANIDELINAYEKNSPTVYYHYFGKNDGMDMIEMNGGCTPCVLQLKNKTLSFPTMDGLLWVDPEKAKAILPDGEIFIDQVTADSVEIDAEQTTGIRFPAKTKDIYIKLAFGAWCNKENIYLEYQLNDSLNWKPVNTDIDAVIFLNNLASGDYVLRIRKLNGFGIDNYSYKTIRFSIVTPWYKTWWFTVLIVLAFGGLVLLYVNLRTRQLKMNQLRLERQVSEKTKELQRKNEELEKNDSIKTRLISIISHDIVTPLKFLTAAGKNLIEKRNAMPEELQKETLEEMANTSQELQMLSTNILNWIKYQNENRRLAKENFGVHELVQQVIGILRSLARQKQLALKNLIATDLTMYQYYEPLKILVYNLLTNAINFSEKGEILIGAERENEFVKIWVNDHGVGMTPEQIEHITADEIIITSANVDKRKGHGLGYLIIKDLLKMTGGTLQIESEKGKGSTISITLPSNQKSN